jgi:RNA polymerase sigma-70 factor (ECF subfamily)
LQEEQALIQRILHGELDLFRELIDRYQRLVSHIVFRMVTNPEDREELCHEVFIKVYQNLSKFQFKSKLSTWIGKIAYNSSINYLRKEKIQLYQDLESPEQNNESLDFEESIYSKEKTPDKISEQKDCIRQIGMLIDSLPEHFRSILTMYHMDQLSYKEIAEITELPEGTIKSYLFRARNILKEKIVAQYQGEKL